MEIKKKCIPVTVTAPNAEQRRLCVLRKWGLIEALADWEGAAKQNTKAKKIPPSTQAEAAPSASQLHRLLPPCSPSRKATAPAPLPPSPSTRTPPVLPCLFLSVRPHQAEAATAQLQFPASFSLSHNQQPHLPLFTLAKIHQPKASSVSLNHNHQLLLLAHPAGKPQFQPPPPSPSTTVTAQLPCLRLPQPQPPPSSS